MRIRIAVLTLLALLVLAAPAAAKRGHLDPSFGKHGKLILPTRLLGPAVTDGFGHPGAFKPKLLALGKGRFLFANRTRIFRFEKNGRLDRKFGQGGYVSVEPPAGQLLTLRDVAVDPSGRILIAATAQDAGSQPEQTPGLNEYGYPLHGPPLTRAAILRLRPNGSPDPSFGSGGVVESTLGFSPPTFEGRSYKTPSVQGLAIASDSQGRPVLAGSVVKEALSCYPFTYLQFARRGFVARFGAGGGLETVSGDPAVAGPGVGSALVAANQGRLLFERYDGPGVCERPPMKASATIALLSSSGAAAGGFAPATVRLESAPSLAADGRGRVVLVADGTTNVAGQAPVAMRFRPNGSLDMSFDGDGEAELRPPALGFGPVAIDANNRPVFAGGIAAGKTPAGLSLLRLTARGKVDDRFGTRGIVRIGFNAAASGSAGAVLIDGAGRILVAGPLGPASDPGSESMVGIARYLPNKH